MCFSNLLTGASDFSYCGDHLKDYGIMYLQGTNGNLVNMDIDCDGALGTGDGSCDSSQDTQGDTAFKDTIKSYKAGIKDLNAYVHSYVVLGNEGSKSGYVTFEPESVGVDPLSVVAVVCGNKMVSMQQAHIKHCSLEDYSNIISSTASGVTPTVTTAHHWLVRSLMLSAEPAMAMPSTATQPTMPTTSSTLPSPVPVLFPVLREPTGQLPLSMSSRLLSAPLVTASLPALAALAALLLLLRPPPSPLAASLPAPGLVTVLEPSAAATMTVLMTWSARAASVPKTTNSAAIGIGFQRRVV